MSGQFCILFDWLKPSGHKLKQINHFRLIKLLIYEQNCSFLSFINTGHDFV